MKRGSEFLQAYDFAPPFYERWVNKLYVSATITTKHFRLNDTAFCFHCCIKGLIQATSSENVWFRTVELKTTNWAYERRD